jgi:hypothetical protein
LPHDADVDVDAELDVGVGVVMGVESGVPAACRPISSFCEGVGALMGGGSGVSGADRPLSSFFITSLLCFTRSSLTDLRYMTMFKTSFCLACLYARFISQSNPCETSRERMVAALRIENGKGWGVEGAMLALFKPSE